jgi:hypothetical protein
MVPLKIPSLGYKFYVIMTFIRLYNFKKGVKFWVLIVEIICLIRYCMPLRIELFFVSINGHYNKTFCFDFIELMFIICWLIAFCNSFLSTMKVVFFHGSSKRVTFVLVRKRCFNKSKSEYEIIPIWRFCKKVP